MPVAAENPMMARKMALLATLAQNLATGLLFGSFGTMMFALESRFGADRSQSSAAISLAVVSLSLTAAWLGTRIGKLPLRLLMSLGATMGSLGFLLLAYATTVSQLWLVYGLLLGPGAGLSGVLASNALAAMWTPSEKLGRTLGWVNAPLAVTIMPLICEHLLKTIGLHGLLIGLAAAQASLLVALTWVKEPAADFDADAHYQKPRSRLNLGLLLTVVLIVGIVSGGGLLKLSHMLPLVTGHGYSFSQANLLLSISGLAGIGGSLILGWISDRIGPSRALAVNALLQGLSWIILLVPSAYGLLIVDAVVVGICGGGLQAIIGALLTDLFGESSFSRVYGYVSLLTLPFLFGVPWLAGYLFVRSGSYTLPISLQIGAFFCAAIGGLFLAFRETRTKESVSA
jgi:MFS family permease